MQFRDVFLGIDIGTTSVKAALVQGNGKGIAQVSEEYPTNFIRAGWVEQSADDWWCATTKAVQKLIQVYLKQSDKICAISVSSQAPTLFGIDKFGYPIAPALIWMDQRAEKICKEELSPLSEEINKYSGNRIDPYYLLPKLLWQKRFQNDQYRRVSKFLQINGWIIFSLTGQCAIDVTHAALTQLFDVYKNQWKQEIFDEFGIAIEKVPEFFECDQIVGKVNRRAAEEWGIMEGIPVAAGCIDGAAAPYGLNLLEAGSLYEMSGQSSGIGTILSEPLFHPNLCLLKHAAKEKWIQKGSMSTSGGALKWYRDKIDQCIGDDSSYNEYDRLAAQSLPGAGGVTFLPYLNGERAPFWNPNLRGLFFGLSLKTQKKDLIRAMMEGTAFALRNILDEFQINNMILDKTLLGTGGGYRSSVWSQIKADILGLPICVKQTSFDAAALGSSYLAMESIGQTPHLKTSGEDKNDVFYLPNHDNQEQYLRGYVLFCQLYQANKELFKKDTINGEIQ